MFPLQRRYERNEAGAMAEVDCPRTIPWSVAEVAYAEYVRRFGDGQTLQRLAERGGFGDREMDMFYPGWRAALARVEGKAK